MPWSGLVDGSLWKIGISTRNKKCVITAEEYQPPVDHHGLKLLHQIQVPGDIIQGRVLSWPKVICRQGSIVVSQFVTHNNPYIQFLVIDLVKELCFVFCDTVHHLRRSYALMGAVECCLSPDLHMMLLRLPRKIARAHTSSLALIARTKYPTKPMTVEENPVAETARFRFHDRKLCMLLFDPRFPRRLVRMQVSEFCTKCAVFSRDQDTDMTVLKTSVPLGQLNTNQVTVVEVDASQNHQNSNDEDSDDSDDSLDPLLIFRTILCKAEYSRSADRIILCCFVEDSLHGGMIARVFILDADTFVCIAKYFQSLSPGDPTDSLDAFQIIFSPCDTRVHVVLPGSDMDQLLCTVDIRKPLSLRNFCRSSILSSLSDSRYVDRLPLPPVLKKYLEFKCNRFVENQSV